MRNNIIECADCRYSNLDKNGINTYCDKLGVERKFEKGFFCSLARHKYIRGNPDITVYDVIGDDEGYANGCLYTAIGEILDIGEDRPRSLTEDEELDIAEATLSEVLAAAPHLSKFGFGQWYMSELIERFRAYGIEVPEWEQDLKDLKKSLEGKVLLSDIDFPRGHIYGMISRKLYTTNPYVDFDDVTAEQFVQMLPSLCDIERIRADQMGKIIELFKDKGFTVEQWERDYAQRQREYARRKDKK